MTTIPSAAASAYARMGNLARATGQGDAAAQVSATKPDFTGMVQDAVQNVVEQGRESDNKALALAQGKSDVVDVVTAIAETEVAFESMVTIRDRVISAYEEIMRMPI